jgi:predicted  nucleic acid-binding Zn-ribbon protein
MPAVKAPPDAQRGLLELQQIDSTLDRLARRRQTLPELADIERLSARLAAIDDELAGAQTSDRDLGLEQAKVENDVETVRSRETRDQQRLDAGQVASPRELETLQSELRSLSRRQQELEDQVLEVMERRETVQGTVAALTAERDKLRGERADAESRRDAALGAIDAEAASARGERSERVGQLPEDLVGLYEKVRASSGGVGAAALRGGRCEGCHLQLTAADLASLRAAAPDEVLRCEECRRILVRTPESGP